MLTIAEIRNGIVIDHIQAGQGIKIFNWLGLDKAPYNVALVVNASSRRMGKKDLLKIDNVMHFNFEILGLIDTNITVNIIENETIVKKIHLCLPEKVENVLICNNPRCVTSTEKYLPHIFHLENRDKRLYRCNYCDEIRSAVDFIR